MSSRDCNDAIYVMNADGSGPVNVSQSPLQDDGWPPIAEGGVRRRRLEM